MRPRAADSGRWRELTEADGSWKSAGSKIESVGFRHKFDPVHFGLPDIPPDIEILDPRSGAIRHKDQKRPEKEAGGN